VSTTELRVVGVLHPGEMGAAIGGVLRGQGHRVLWASQGRSSQSAERASGAGLEDASSIGALLEASQILLSVCPPHAALDVAAAVAGFGGLYVDANAVSPATARAVGERVEQSGATFVDGSIVGMPPRSGTESRLYLSGSEAGAIAVLFAGTELEAVVLDGPPGAASALKMAYAGWTKGSLALLLAMRAAARAEGVDEALLAEWARSLPDVPGRVSVAARAAARKGWRWIGEMEEIAATLENVGLPPGFHDAAAEVFRRTEEIDPGLEGNELVEHVLAELLHAELSAPDSNRPT
jgi:3-hydroxyisobutyrate dehydrogenase-like beta-hydroxyacid dehydrogenase